MEASVLPQQLGEPKMIRQALQHPRSPLIVLSCLLLVTMLTACGKTLDVSKIQDAIKEDVIKKGATSLKSVFCPKDVPPEVGKTFECIGELDGGNAFAISVKQEDAEGKVQWDIPNAKGILNLEKLQTLFLESIKTEKGAPPEINCGGIYRAVKPGDSFDCVVTPKPKSADKSDSAAKTKGADTPAAEQTKDSETAKTGDQAKGSDNLANADQGKATDSKTESTDQAKVDSPNDKKTTEAKGNSNKSDESNPDAKAKEGDKADKSAAKTGNKSGKGDKSKVLAGQLVAIRVSVDVDGNITWQQILEDPEVKVAATAPEAATAITGTAPNLPVAAGTKPDAAVKPDATAKKADGVEPAISTDAGED
jgi:hypothetical protein